MKYIIEIKPEYEGTTKGIIVLGIKNNCLCVDELAIEELEELNSDYINEHFGSLQDEAYKRGINDGSLDVKERVDGAYQKGLNDAWECGKKLAWTAKYGGYGDRLGDVFGRDDTFDFYDYTPNEAIAKLKAYEEKQKEDDKIEVGDEVIYNGTTKCVVVTPETDEKYASLLDCNGIHYSADHRECKKTGRHFDIKSILEAMKA